MNQYRLFGLSDFKSWVSVGVILCSFILFYFILFLFFLFVFFLLSPNIGIFGDKKVFRRPV